MQIQQRDPQIQQQQLFDEKVTIKRSFLTRVICNSGLFKNFLYIQIQQQHFHHQQQHPQQQRDLQMDPEQYRQQ